MQVYIKFSHKIAYETIKDNFLPLIRIVANKLFFNDYLKDIKFTF